MKFAWSLCLAILVLCAAISEAKPGGGKKNKKACRPDEGEKCNMASPMDKAEQTIEKAAQKVAGLMDMNDADSADLTDSLMDVLTHSMPIPDEPPVDMALIDENMPFEGAGEAAAMEAIAEAVYDVATSAGLTPEQADEVMVKVEMALMEAVQEAVAPSTTPQVDAAALSTTMP